MPRPPQLCSPMPLVSLLSLPRRGSTASPSWPTSRQYRRKPITCSHEGPIALVNTIIQLSSVLSTACAGPGERLFERDSDNGRLRLCSGGASAGRSRQRGLWGIKSFTDALVGQAHPSGSGLSDPGRARVTGAFGQNIAIGIAEQPHILGAHFIA